MLKLDIHTLALTTGLIFLVIGAHISYFSSVRRTYSGTEFWSLAAMLSGIGMLLLGQRNVLPDFFSIIVSNLFIAAYLVCVFVGLTYFLDRRTHWIEHTCLMGLLMLGFCYFTYFSPNVNARIVLISLFLAYYCLKIVVLMLRIDPASHLRYNMFIWVIGGLGLYYLVRAAYSGFLEQSLTSFMKAGTFHMIAFLVYILSGFWILVGLLFFGIKRLEHDLSRTRAEVRQLSGLLPICASCKKIRDDKGYWNQIESYIQQHSEAEFSHGICPECSEKLYGDKDWYVEMKKKKKNM